LKNMDWGTLKGEEKRNVQEFEVDVTEGERGLEGTMKSRGSGEIFPGSNQGRYPKKKEK